MAENGDGEPVFVTWKDYSSFCVKVSADIASLKVWQKVILLLLSSNFLMNILQVIKEFSK